MNCHAVYNTARNDISVSDKTAITDSVNFQAA